MHSYSIADIKKELRSRSPEELLEMLLVLSRFKKDNKEFLAYLLFDSAQQQAFVQEVKKVIDLHFSEIEPEKNTYFIKKSLRKLIRLLNKYNKFIGDKSASTEIGLHFCAKLKNSNIRMEKSQQIENMFFAQIKKIKSNIETLHEDLQSDYQKELDLIL